MCVRRAGSRFLLALLLGGSTLFLPAGCSQEEELKPDPGASPFYPGPAAERGAPNHVQAAGDQPIGGSPASPTEAGQTGAGTSATGSSSAGTKLRSSDIEQQMSLVMRAAQKGDVATAVQLLDQVLGVEPLHREALFGRAALALDQARLSKTPEDRAALVQKAVDLTRTMRRVYELPKPSEQQLFGRVLYIQAHELVQKGRIDQALDVLKEATETGMDPYSSAEIDESMAPLRSSPRFQKELKARRDTNVAEARKRVKEILDRPVDLAFNFTLPDLEGKPVSLADFKGKVVLVDFWGTWCEPCREAIPRLSELYRLHHHRGLEIVGLAYERQAHNESEARTVVKRFVGETHVPYTCLIGDLPTAQQIPKFQSFPTSLVLDRSGKVRVLITENEKYTLDLLADTVEILLADPPPQSADAAKKSR
jgi:thiol-disulfide isomerase/thioredoxin